jgi:hypothetical protein
MVEPRHGAEEVPGVHRYIELLDLLPPSSCGWCAAKARRVAQVVKPRWMNVTERELLEAIEG